MALQRTARSLLCATLGIGAAGFEQAIPVIQRAVVDHAKQIDVSKLDPTVPKQSLGT